MATRSAFSSSTTDCVAPVGEQGSDIARVAVLNADYAETTAGVQINRFCASGLEAVNMAAAKVMVGEAIFAIGGGVDASFDASGFARVASLVDAQTDVAAAIRDAAALLERRAARRARDRPSR